MFLQQNQYGRRLKITHGQIQNNAASKSVLYFPCKHQIFHHNHIGLSVLIVPYCTNNVPGDSHQHLQQRYVLALDL